MAPRSLALLVALLAALAVAPASAGALEVGIAADAELLNGDPREAARTVGQWRRLGVDSVRLQVQWSRVAPDPASAVPPPDFDPANHQDARYRWDDYDRAIGMLTQAGIKPLLLLGGPPPLWGSSQPAAGSPRVLPSAFQFGSWAAAVARRYGDRVQEYILWNEPNLPLWLQPQASCKKKRCTPVSPHIYRFMVRAAYPAIKIVDPQSTVLIGALAPSGSNLRSRNANMRPLQFLRAMGCVDALMQPVRDGGCRGFQPAFADGIAYHPHSTRNPPHQGYENPDDAALADLRQVERLVDRLQRMGRLAGSTTPLGFWLDEYAYQTNPPDKVRGVTPGRQDRWLQQAAYLSWRDNRVRLLAQYLWRDERTSGPPRWTGWQSGLLTPEGEEKPALAHFDDPFWVDFERGSVWGQIRPGGAHDVEIQRRRAGAGTPWETVRSVRTNGAGVFYEKLQLERFAAYRAVWGGGRITGSHVAAPLTDRMPVAERKERSEGLPVERRTAAKTGAVPVPRSFAGMSMEYRSVSDYIGSGGVLNPVFLQLTRELSRGGNGGPPLRFGGDSTDYTWFNPDGSPRPPTIATDVTPSWLGHLALWARTAGTPLIMGLNMGLGDPARAAALAGASRAAVGPGLIRSFELGNEPDLYPTPRTYAVGRNVLARNQKRPTGYGHAEYKREAAEFAGAIKAAAPDVALSGGGFASASWDELQDELLTSLAAIRAWSVHAYPLPTCDPAIRRRGGERLIPRLLASSAYVSIVDRMRQLAAVAASHGTTVQLSETNSSICGGLRGVSDTMASALWGTDLLFGLADAGVRNVNFHTWTGSHYGPVEMGIIEGRPVAEVRPLFYGMLLYNRATPPGARFIDVGPNPPSARLKTWGTIDRRGTRRFVVINKDPATARKVFLRVPGGGRRASVRRLLAPTLKSRNQVTFAGQGWGRLTTTGRPRGRAVVSGLEQRSGAFQLVMPAGSAALVEVPAG